MGLQQITGNEIAAGSIAATDLASASITGDKLVANTVSGDVIGQNAISSNNIVGGTITTTQIASNTISNTNIQTGAIEVYSSSRSTGLFDGMRNRIINGAMVIDQRATSVTATSYTVDRWSYNGSQISKATVAQSSTAPTGFINSLNVTSSSAYSITSGDYFTLEQPIEGLNCTDLAWGTVNAKTVTLSFQVQSSLTGTFGGVLYAGTGSYSYPFSYTISSANTWTAISVTIAGPTSGTFVTTNATCFTVCFGLGVGSTYSGTAGSWQASVLRSVTGATSVVGTNGATFYITGCQLEVGSTATSFDYRPYGTELALCQRYFVKFSKEANYCPLIPALAYNTTDAYSIFSFPIRMRSAPTGTFSAASDFLLTGNNGEGAATSMGFNVSSTYSAEVNFGKSVTQGYSYWVRYTASGGADNSKFIAFSAEL